MLISCSLKQWISQEYYHEIWESKGRSYVSFKSIGYCVVHHVIWRQGCDANWFGLAEQPNSRWTFGMKTKRTTKSMNCQQGWYIKGPMKVIYWPHKHWGWDLVHLYKKVGRQPSIKLNTFRACVNVLICLFSASSACLKFEDQQQQKIITLNFYLEPVNILYFGASTLQKKDLSNQNLSQI